MRNQVSRCALPIKWRPQQCDLIPPSFTCMANPPPLLACMATPPLGRPHFRSLHGRLPSPSSHLPPPECGTPLVSTGTVYHTSIAS